MNESLVLASTSIYRKQLLDRLQVPFTILAPNVDESRQPHESAQQLVERLAISKAKACASQAPNSLIIGSDQVATLHGEIITKPHTHERALTQLLTMQGQTVSFLTGLCVYDSASKQIEAIVDQYDVCFKTLDKG